MHIANDLVIGITNKKTVTTIATTINNIIFKRQEKILRITIPFK